MRVPTEIVISCEFIQSNVIDLTDVQTQENGASSAKVIGLIPFQDVRDRIYDFKAMQIILDKSVCQMDKYKESVSFIHPCAYVLTQALYERLSYLLTHW